MIPLGWIKCLKCAKAHMRGFLHCPHCGERSHLYPEQPGVEENMPKTTTQGGASNGWEPGEPELAAAPVPEVPEATPAPEPEPTAEEQPEEEPEEPLSAADVAAGYTDLSFAQLRAAAKERGLSAGGTAVELAARLAEHDAAPAIPAEPSGA